VLELEDKFNLPSVILEAKSFRDAEKAGHDNPFQQPAIIVTSMNFATVKKDMLKLVPWDLAVIVSRLFWAVTQSVLADSADFDDHAMTFRLHTPPPVAQVGEYHLISKKRENVE
jgi:hypothetical protein